MSEPTVSEHPAVYQKHDSFVGIRHHGALAQDVLNRVRRLFDQLSSMALAPNVTKVLRCACEELLAPDTLAQPLVPFTLRSYVIEEISRLTDEELRRYLFYRYRYEIYPQRHIIDAFPPCLQVEPTSVCNYRCVFCYQQDRTFSTKGSGHMGAMSFDLFRSVIDQAEGRCEALTLASRGEPLLCPDIQQMLGYVKGKFLALKMNTNASRLTERLCHAILEAGVNTLVFSADAASEPAYGRLRVGGRFDQVHANIARFKEIRAKHYPNARTITRVSGVKVEGTPGLDEMERVWGDLVDQVAFVQYNPWNTTYERPLHRLTAPCSELWLRMFVWWDGAVNPCENDYKSTLSVGNATEDLGSLWRSSQYTRLREQHLQRQRGACSPCNRCPVI